MANTKELLKRIEELEKTVALLTGHAPRREDVPVTERPDYIEHGSEKHMAFLGLREANEEDKADAARAKEGGEVPLVYQGFTMQDNTLYGVNVRPEFLRTILMQKVHELTYPVPPLQSIDRTAPFYTLPIWVPDEVPVSGIA